MNLFGIEHQAIKEWQDNRPIMIADETENELYELVLRGDGLVKELRDTIIALALVREQHGELVEELQDAELELQVEKVARQEAEATSAQLPQGRTAWIGRARNVEARVKRYEAALLSIKAKPRPSGAWCQAVARDALEHR